MWIVRTAHISTSLAPGILPTTVLQTLGNPVGKVLLFSYPHPTEEAAEAPTEKWSVQSDAASGALGFEISARPHQPCSQPLNTVGLPSEQQRPAFQRSSRNPQAALLCPASHPCPLAAGIFSHLGHLSSICSLGGGSLGKGGIKMLPGSTGQEGWWVHCGKQPEQKVMLGRTRSQQRQPHGECLGEKQAARGPWEGEETLSDL